jgi:hypothetical protein
MDSNYKVRQHFIYRPSRQHGIYWLEMYALMDISGKKIRTLLFKAFEKMIG